MAIDVVTEEVANNLEEIAVATRTLNSKSIGFFLSGNFVGFAVGMYFGHKFMKDKLRAEAFKESEEEVARIREHYHLKLVANEPKPSPEEIIVREGYSTRPLPAPVPGLIEPHPRQVEEDADLEAAVEEELIGWDLEQELLQREANPDDPYVLHQEEFYARETGYRQAAFTYYELDHVLVDDNDRKRDIERIIGTSNNLKFGHGSDDPDSVFIRNNEKQIEVEITRLHKSFEEEVLGIEPDHEPDDDES